MKDLTADQLLEAMNSGVNAYYEDQIRVNYPYMTLVNNIIGVEAGLSDMKTELSKLYDEKTELLTLIAAVDLESICAAFEKCEDDTEMIAKFESSIAFSTEGQKYAFLSAINSLS